METAVSKKFRPRFGVRRLLVPRPHRPAYFRFKNALPSFQPAPFPPAISSPDSSLTQFRSEDPCRDSPAASCRSEGGCRGSSLASFRTEGGSRGFSLTSFRTEGPSRGFQLAPFRTEGLSRGFQLAPFRTEKSRFSIQIEGFSLFYPQLASFCHFCRFSSQNRHFSKPQPRKPNIVCQRKIPNTVTGFIRSLKKTAKTYRNTADVGKRAIGAALYAQINDQDPTSFLSRLILEKGQVGMAGAVRGTLTEQVKGKFEQLAMYCSHFHQVLDMGIQRGDFQAGARSFYDRDLHASAIPTFGSYDDADEGAVTIVEGETNRQTAEGVNFKPMALPSADDVRVLQEDFAGLRNQAQTAGTQSNQEQEEVGALFDQARALVIEVWDTVEFFFRHDLDPGSRRDKCAEWGVVYVGDPGETPEPPPVDPPTPPPAP
jgi:hypothetical protein